MSNKYFNSIILILSLVTIIHSSDIPYPIIFIHGLDSSEETWDTTINHLEMTLGDHNDEHIYHAVLNAYGRMTHIQGQDGVLGNGDDDVLVTFNNEDNVLSDGQLFSLNFKNFWNQVQNNPQLFIHDNNTPGDDESTSNESAIYKQGYALKKCIEAVLYSTEKDKVILVGHSMGGLAIREYLQRIENSIHKWWIDPAVEKGHKIAKVVTIGTPHLGSNFFEWPFLNETEGADDTREMMIPNLNSEAVRDIRYNYNIFGLQGRYLYGGDESNAELFTLGYHNFDVNCDGDQDDVIVGINEGEDGTTSNAQMPLPTNIEYTWITSNYGPCNDEGDCIVDIDRQWLHVGNSPSPLGLADSLLTSRVHWEETNDYYSIIRGLDEPDSIENAYDIELNKIYSGFITFQSNMIDDDDDYYRINNTLYPNLTITVNCLNISGVNEISVINAFGNILYSTSYEYPQTVITVEDLNPSQNYYLRISGVASNVSYENPYEFHISGFNPYTGHDIEVTNMDLPPFVNLGGSIDINVHVHNGGLFNENNVPVEFIMYAPDGQQVDSEVVNIGQIDINQNIIINSLLSGGNSEGIYTISAEAQNQYDSNFSNNYITGSVYIGDYVNGEEFNTGSYWIYIDETLMIEDVSVHYIGGNTNEDEVWFQLNGNDTYVDVGQIKAIFGGTMVIGVPSFWPTGCQFYLGSTSNDVTVFPETAVGFQGETVQFTVTAPNGWDFYNNDTPEFGLAGYAGCNDNVTLVDWIEFEQNVSDNEIIYSCNIPEDSVPDTYCTWVGNEIQQPNDETRIVFGMWHVQVLSSFHDVGIQLLNPVNGSTIYGQQPIEFTLSNYGDFAEFGYYTIILTGPDNYSTSFEESVSISVDQILPVSILLNTNELLNGEYTLVGNITLPIDDNNVNNEISSMFLVNNEYLLGDLNYDGDVDILDIVLLVDNILTGSSYINLGDFNGDGTNDILDIVMLVEVILNPLIEGCTDSNACNYNPDATIDDGSCEYECSVTDIDGNVYSTIMIDSQEWMAENLKVTHYSDGEGIPLITSFPEGSNITTGAYCYYDNESENIEIYGNMYNWYVVEDEDGICPEGWSVPSLEEWQQLVEYLGGGYEAGGPLKATGTIQGGDGLWWEPNVGATNESDFTALPGGNWNHYWGYEDLDRAAFFWSSTEYSESNAIRVYLYYNDTDVLYPNDSNQDAGSIRCVRDSD